jgi:hypothetical protein
MTLFDLAHTASVFVAASIGYFFGYAIEGAVLMMTFFVGRELTQAEYKWIQRYGLGRRYNLPWWGALDPRVWDTHSFWWNTTLPLLVTILIVGYV